LAAKLTSWNLDIRSELDVDPALGSPIIVSSNALLEDIGLSTRTLNLLLNGGLKNLTEVSLMTQSSFTDIKGFGLKSYEELLACIDQYNKSKVKSRADANKEKVMSSSKVEPKEAVAKKTEPDVNVNSDTLKDVNIPESQDINDVNKVSEESLNKVEEKGSDVTETKPSLNKEPDVSATSNVKIGTSDVPGLNAPLQGLDTQTSVTKSEDIDDESLSSIRDLPEDVWSVKSAGGKGQGSSKIRFSEDIEGLKGGLMARRLGTRLDIKKDKSKKKSKGGKRR
jgi:hypothetical protein